MFNSKEKQRLKQYSKDIKSICTVEKKLNQKQIQRLNFFTTRVLEYCRTQRIVEYSQNVRIKDKELIPNAEEKAVYKQLFDEFNNLAVRVKNDEVLTESTKREFNRNLKTLIGHTKGKLNVRNKYGRKKQVYGYVRTVNVGSDINEQIVMIQRFVKDNNILLDAIYVDEKLDEVSQNRVNTAFYELNKKVMNSKKKTVIIVEDISKISRGNKNLQKIVKDWDSKNVQLIVLKK